MAYLRLLLILLVFITATLAELEYTIDDREGRVFLKNQKHHRYLIFDPLSVDFEPKALLWNVPDVIPPKGGAWFHLAKSPVSKDDVDFNLVGGLDSNFTLCASMLQPEEEPSLHHIHGYLDFDHLEAPECRWLLKKCWDGENYWVINKLYEGHLKEGKDKYNVDPLRVSVFLETQDSETDEREMWNIGTVLEPNDPPADYE